MKIKADRDKSIWYQVQESFIIHKNLLEEAYLHNRFVFKACLMHPKIYHDMMQDEQAKSYRMFQSAIDEVTLWGIPLKITTEVDSVSWIIDLEDKVD